MRKIAAALLLILLISLAVTWLRDTGVPLIRRRLLFSSPGRSKPLLSPDGTRLSFLAVRKLKVNVWVAPPNNWRAAVAVTSDSTKGVGRYFWAHTNDHILYLQDQDGDVRYRRQCFPGALDFAQDGLAVGFPTRDRRTNLMTASPQGGFRPGRTPWPSS